MVVLNPIKYLFQRLHILNLKQIAEESGINYDKLLKRIDCEREKKKVPKDIQLGFRDTTALSNYLISSFNCPAFEGETAIYDSDPKVELVGKVNWKAINRDNFTVGESGEFCVLKYEERKLREFNLEHLIEKMEHTSRGEGDGVGYDIKSFNEKGEEIYIEVKSTTKNSRGSFYMTPTEIKRAKELNEKFFLYRVYSMSLREMTAKIEIHSLEYLKNNFRKEATLFKLNRVSKSTRTDAEVFSF